MVILVIYLNILELKIMLSVTEKQLRAIGKSLPSVRAATPLLVLASMGIGVPSAHAALSDSIHPFASASYSHDDNLFRLPENSPGFSGQRSDFSREIDYGAFFERPVGQQTFSGRVKLTRVNFDRNEQLNYNGKDMLALWNWRLGAHLDGELGATYNETLASFSDSHSNQRNLRTQRREYASGLWRFHPSWRLNAGFSRQKFDYELSTQRQNDRTEDVAHGGFDFLSSSGSRFGLVFRHLSGKYPNNAQFGSIVLDNGYVQKEIKANIDWKVTGTTQLQLLAGRARRTHAFFSERDASGVDGRGTFVWTPRGKIIVTTVAWREFQAIESNISGNSRNKGGNVALAWDALAKVRLDAMVRRETRDFDTVSNLVLPFRLQDRTKTASLGLTYSPLQSIQASTSFYHEKRDGNTGFIGGGEYRTNGVSINITAQF